MGGDDGADGPGFSGGRRLREKDVEHLLQFERIGGVPGAGVQEGPDVFGKQDDDWNKHKKEN